MIVATAKTVDHSDGEVGEEQNKDEVTYLTVADVGQNEGKKVNDAL